MCLTRSRLESLSDFLLSARSMARASSCVESGAKKASVPRGASLRALAKTLSFASTTLTNLSLLRLCAMLALAALILKA